MTKKNDYILKAHEVYFERVRSLKDQVSSLRKKLGGVLMEHGVDGPGQFAMSLSALCPDAEIFEDAGDIVEGNFRKWLSAKGNAVGWLKCAQKHDLRTLRRDLERFVESSQAEECVIFIEGDINALLNATVIARLLGY